MTEPRLGFTSVNWRQYTSVLPIYFFLCTLSFLFHPLILPCPLPHTHTQSNFILYLSLTNLLIPKPRVNQQLLHKRVFQELNPQNWFALTKILLTFNISACFNQELRLGFPPLILSLLAPDVATVPFSICVLNALIIYIYFMLVVGVFLLAFTAVFYRSLGGKTVHLYIRQGC